LNRRIIFIVILFLTIPLVSWAQPPYKACFHAVNKRGCAPFTVNVVSCYTGPTPPNPFYNYDFVNQPAVQTQNTSFTYNTPGTYIIRQTVNDGISSIVDTTDTIQVLGTPNPLFGVTTCAGLKIHVDITDTNYDNYTLDYGDGTIVTAASLAHTTYIYADNLPKTISVRGNYVGLAIPCTGATVSKTITPISTLTTPDILDLTVTNQNTTTGTINLRFNGIMDRVYNFDSKINNGVYSSISTTTAATSGILTQTISGLNTQINTYTFRIQNIDLCGSPPSANSAEIASIIISPTSLSGANKVIFNSNGGLVFTNLALYRNNNLLQNNAVSPYIDNAVICGTDYCYQNQGTLPTISTTTGTNHKSYSVTSCIKASYTGTAPIVNNLNSTVEGNNVKLVWDVPALNAAVPSIPFYSVYRKDASAYQKYGSSNANSYLDNGASVNTEPYCYEINYKDACNNTSLLSLNTCTVYLTVSRTDETNTLSWTPYTGYQSGIKEYIVENLDDNGNIVLSKSVGLNTTFTETADATLSQIIYRIRVVPIGAENLISISNTVRLDLTPQVYMPNIFTPNNDGDNDVLEVKGKYFKSIKMTILNKWGEVVFISEDINKGWDGNYKGQPASVDSYAYHVVALDNTGKEISLKGVVSLLR
jgi:gliding motility-associated-like protein